MQSCSLAALSATLSAIVLYASAAAGPVVRDLDGRRVRPIAAGISVLIFVRTDCPISNRYAPELARIDSAFKEANVRFWLVYVDPKQTPEDARAHRRDYNYPFEAVLDSTHELVRFSGAKATPEVAVYSSDRLVYRGRIDNKYVNVGSTRQSATVHDLEDALRSAIQRKPLRTRTTTAVGCYIEDLR